MPSYTLDELIKLMEPQARRDKILMSECITGLEVYAALHAQKDPDSPKIAEMRELVDRMVCYWGLNEPDLYENAKPLEDYLRSFDALIEDAKSGAEFTEADILKAGTNTIYGLYRYGEEMIVCQGDDAKYDILSVSALMKEIAAVWSFESDVLDGLTAKLDKAANRMGEVVWRDSPELPGVPAKAETVDQYELKHEIQFDDGQGFAIGYYQYGMKPFVVLPFSDNNGNREYGVGSPFGTLEQAKEAFTSLVAEHEPPMYSDKALIRACIDGLGLYAAYQKQDNTFSRVPDEMKKLVETLVGYWGLDDNEHAPSLAEYLDAFEEQVFAAKSGTVIRGDTYQSCADVVNGLYRYGQELIVAQGSDAMSEILDMSDLMKDVAEYYGYETDTLHDMADQLRTEVRDMLADIHLPGQPTVGENIRYQIQQAILFNNNRGFVLAHNPKAPDPYVTWQFVDREKGRSYDDGRYHSTEERARLCYISRVTTYMESYKVTEKPIPTAAAEMDAEQNYNMVDGVRNNEDFPPPDLTDGQTYTEIRELAPEMLPDEATAEDRRIPVQVFSESQPLVTVTFSEDEQLRNIVKLPLYLANTLFFEADEKQSAKYCAVLHSIEPIAPYLKTDFRIDFIMNGKPDSYSGRYNVGDGDGTLIEHIQDHAEYSRNDEDHQSYLDSKGEKETANAQYDTILNELVPFFDKHCELSKREANALSELMEIHEDAAGAPSDSAKVRIEHLEAVVEQCVRSRAALNGTELAVLSDRQHPAAEVAGEKSGQDGKASVLDQIKAARTAPKTPPKPKPEQGKKKHEPEL